MPNNQQITLNKPVKFTLKQMKNEKQNQERKQLKQNKCNENSEKLNQHKNKVETNKPELVEQIRQWRGEDNKN